MAAWVGAILSIAMLAGFRGPAAAQALPPGVEAALARASAAGGTAEAGVVELPNGIGWIGHMRDLDGNRVGLHAPGR